MTFEEYWEEKGHFGWDPESVAKLAWDAAREDAVREIACGDSEATK